MRVWSHSFEHGHPIPERCAFCKPDPAAHATLSDNRNPHLAWDDVPEATRSFVVVCVDTDVPSRPDDVNREGVTVPATLPRVPFYHWILADIPAHVRSIEEGQFSDGVTPRGKPGPEGPLGTRQGLNDYTKWFAGDAEMEGQYYGYDGPCPPWNDELVHHYHFDVYALDVDRAPIEGTFGGEEILSAIEGHVLAHARLTGTYTLNPALR